MTREQMDFLHGIIAELLALPGKRVVWAQQNMPRLCCPFATLQLSVNDMRRARSCARQGRGSTR